MGQRMTVCGGLLFGLGLTLYLGCSAAPGEETSASVDEAQTRDEAICVRGEIPGTVNWMVDTACGCDKLKPGTTEWEMCSYQSGLASCLGIKDCVAGLSGTLPTLNRVEKYDGRTWASLDLESTTDRHLRLSCAQIKSVRACIDALNKASSKTPRPYAYPAVEGHFGHRCQPRPSRCGFPLTMPAEVIHDPCPGSCSGYHN